MVNIQSIRLVENNNIPRARFEQLYRKEPNADTKERMLLVLNVVYDKHIPAQVPRDLIEVEHGLLTG